MCRNTRIFHINNTNNTGTQQLYKEDTKQTSTLLVHYNAEVRYALQLRHLINKTQSRPVNRKSRFTGNGQ